MQRICYVLSSGDSHFKPPGSALTRRILDYIQYAKEKGCSMTGPEDADILRLNVLKGEV